MKYYVYTSGKVDKPEHYDMKIQGADALRLELWYMTTLDWELGEQVELISCPSNDIIVETVKRFQERNPEIFKSDFRLEVRG